MSLSVEKYSPYVVGLLLAICWWYLDLSFPKKDSVLSSTLSVSGIFVGFLATSKAILITLGGDLMRHIRNSGYIDDLISYVSQAIWTSLIFCIVNVVGFFVTDREDWYSTLWILSGTISALTFIRVTKIMLKVFRYSGSEDG